jgi:hypothetical protein
MFKFVYQQGWITKVFLAFLAFSFIIGTAIMWGPGGLNFGFGNYVIKVGDITVSPKEFLLELTRLQNQYGDKLNKDQLKKAALNNLIITAVFSYLAQRDGFYVSDKEITDFIRNVFSVKGTFKVENFERYLQMLRLTPGEYRDIVKKTLLATKYKSAVHATSYANDKTLEVILLPYTLKVKAEIVKVPLEVFEKNIHFSDKELKEFYKKIEENFYEELPARVEIYFAKTEEEAQKLYKLLKEGKNDNLTPVKVLEENAKPSEEVEEVFYKTLKSKKVAIVKTDNGFYIGIYKPSQRRILPFEKVKKQVEEIYKKYKATQWVQKHKASIEKEILTGNYKGEKQIVDLLGINLISNFGLKPEDLFDILNGKNVFTVVLPDGVYLIKVLSVTIEPINDRNIVKTYKTYLRNRQYLRKLQEVLNYLIRTNEVPIEINQKLLQRI